MKVRFLFFLVVIISRGLLLAASGLPSAQEVFQKLQEADQSHRWKDLLTAASFLIYQTPTSPLSHDSYYYQGKAYYNLSDYDLANQSFSKYLQQQTYPKFFSETMQYKFDIAKKFHHGARKHIFGAKKLPKWASAKEEALKIYEELISMLATDEISNKALFAKGELLAEFGEYEESIETYNQLIRRFPSSEEAIESFLSIGKVYLLQCNPKHQDISLLSLAELNLKRFKEAFPNEEKIKDAEKNLVQIKEIYAKGLLEIGQFYERTNKPKAAIIYYSKIQNIFPHTPSAELAEKRLFKLQKKK